MALFNRVRFATSQAQQADFGGCTSSTGLKKKKKFVSSGVLGFFGVSSNHPAAETCNIEATAKGFITGVTTGLKRLRRAIAQQPAVQAADTQESHLAFNRLTQALGFSSLGCCTRPVTASFTVPKGSGDSCSGTKDNTSSPVCIVVHCEGDLPSAAAEAEPVMEAAAAGPVDDELAAFFGDGDFDFDQPADLAFWAGQTSAVAASVMGPALSQLSPTPSHDQAEGNKPSQRVKSLEQQQEYASALLTLESSAGSSNHCQLSENHKAALLEEGRQALLATDAKLTDTLLAAKATDAMMKRMTKGEREQWFQEHAGRHETDAPDTTFDEQWDSLSPEELAMAAELQARR